MGLSSRPLPRLDSIPKPVRLVAGPVGFGLAYFAVTQLSLALVAPEGIATFWPVSGLYLGVLLAVRKRNWPALALAALLGSIAANLVAGTPVANSIAFAFPNAVEGILAAVAVERLAGGRVNFTRGRGLAALLAGGALAAGLAALSGALAANRALDAPFAETWLQWWAADYVGMLACAPLLLGGLSLPRRPDQRRVIETAVLVAGLAATSLLVLAADPGEGFRAALPAAAALPFLLWFGWNYGPRTVALAGLGLSLAAGYFTAQGLGPFARPELETSAGVLGLQIFLAVALTAALGAAAAAGARRRLASSLDRVTAERASIQEELKELETAHSAVRAELERSESESRRLGNSLKDAEREGSRLREQLGRINAEREALERELAARTKERDSARADGDRARGEIDELKSRLARTAEELTRVADELERRKAEERRLKEERDGLLARRREVEERLAAAGARLEQLQGQLTGRTRELEQVKGFLTERSRELHESREALTGLERDRSGLRGQLEAKAAELERRKEYGAKLVEERDGLRAWRRRAEEELAAATTRRDELEGMLAEEQREADSLRQSLTVQAGEAESLRRSLTVQAGEAEGLRESLTAEAGEAERLREALDAAVRDAHELCEQLDARTAELDARTAELDARTAELERARSERDRLTIELRGSEAARAHATQALDDVRESLAEANRRGEALAAERNGRSEAGLDGILDSDRPMALLDGDARIELANQAMAALTGLPADRLQGVRLPELVHSAETADVEAGLRRFAEGNLRRVSARQRLLRAHGEPVQARLSLSVVRREHGEADFLLEVEAGAAPAQPAPPALAVVSG